MFDVKDFSSINISYGTDTGDKLLASTVERIKDVFEPAFNGLRKAYTTGEICLKPEKELEMDLIYDETPLYYAPHYRGDKTTESALRLGWISEEDVEDPPEE